MKKLMRGCVLRASRRAVTAALLASGCRGAWAQTPVTEEVQRLSPPEQRMPGQQVRTTGALQGIVFDEYERALPGVRVELERVSVAGAEENKPRALKPDSQSSGDGIFRLVGISPGTYDLLLLPPGGATPFRQSAVRINAGEVLSVRVRLKGFTSVQPPSPLPQAQAEVLDDGAYKELSRRPDSDGNVVAAKELDVPAERYLAEARPDRWNAELPDRPHGDNPTYHRYGGMEAPFVLGHWFDPFNRNQIKADRPLFGRTFFSFTGDAITGLDVRRLPVTSGISSASADSSPFFGRGEQFFAAQTFRVTGDLFHGDTAAFRPVDWRVRVTAAANLNYVNARENQAISPDDRRGTTRYDTKTSLQEAFGEVKLADEGPNYDFVNLRVGIQQFVSDFRGFIFADEQPGVRLFGNLKSNRFQWNLVGFDLLEKDTNSGLNTFHRRGREVAIANVFIQDFGAKGYTSQFSYHFVRDEGKLHYDENGFLVRPAPIGNVVAHRIDTHYAGWTGDGHLGRTNITHAFYQAWGTDQFNQIAGKRVDINAQLAALELSRDYDWLRFRASMLYASGDDDPRDGTARGFSSIVDAEAFAGGEFSFFNREGIRFTGTGVALTANDSFLPDLRSSKDEGQSNFVNPGLYLYNTGVDARVLPTLRLSANVSFLQFARTQSLIFLLQENGIPRTIGLDTSVGAVYRPFLSDNIVITGGVATLIPGQGLRDFFTPQTLYSIFGTIRFHF